MLNCEKLQLSRAIRRQTCLQLAKEHAQKVLSFGKPVVLSHKRYNTIREHAGQKSDEQLEREEREKLRKAANAAAIQSVYTQPTAEEILAQNKRNLDLKAERARASLAVSKDIAESLRRQKVAKAELLIQKLKNGPRELRSAAIQSEMLRARDVQAEINEIIKDSVKKQEQADKDACQEQYNSFIGEEQQRKQERQEREKEYKQEMYASIRENERMRCDKRRALIEQERRERAQIDLEIEMQRKRERLAIEKKREMLRKNAVEAMKMVEERKRRDALYDEVEDRRNCVYHAGRSHLAQLKEQQDQQSNEERKKRMDANTELLRGIQQRLQNNEAERIRRDIDNLKLKFDEEEQRKRDREKESKLERIAAHLQEMENIRKNKERECEAKRFEIAQRFKNAEVNARYDEADRLEQQTRAKCVRARLMAQEEERQRVHRQRAAQSFCENKRNEEDDHFFFSYAYKLMQDAKNKHRPLYPYRRVINDYKRNNMRSMQAPKLPRHMISNVNVQQQQAEWCGQNADSSPSMSVVTAETLEQMAKIDALLAEEERMRLAKGPKLCKSSNCLTETKEPQNANVRNDGLQQQDDCDNGDTDSAKLRYGIDELKQLATPAPSVH